ncbi:3223_t:CDS:10, partial [Racocetra fulgida]
DTEKKLADTEKKLADTEKKLADTEKKLNIFPSESDLSLIERVYRELKELITEELRIKVEEQKEGTLATFIKDKIKEEGKRNIFNDKWNSNVQEINEGIIKIFSQEVLTGRKDRKKEEGELGKVGGSNNFVEKANQENPNSINNFLVFSCVFLVAIVVAVILLAFSEPKKRGKKEETKKSAAAAVCKTAISSVQVRPVPPIALVAQGTRAFDFGSKGRGFKSYQACQKNELKKWMEIKIITQARKKLRGYRIIKEFISGLVLSGQEIKSLRNYQSSIDEAYVMPQDGEVYIVNMNITPYKYSRGDNFGGKRKRKLLLTRQEIKDLIYQTRAKTKLKIALAQHLRKYQIKEKIKEKEIRRKIKKKDFCGSLELRQQLIKTDKAEYSCGLANQRKATSFCTKKTKCSDQSDTELQFFEDKPVRKENFAPTFYGERKYHDFNEPTIEDRAYDQYLKELERLEKEYDFIFPNSPTKKIGYSRSEKLAPVYRKIPMLSLDSVDSFEELLRFDERTKKTLKNKGDIEYLCDLNYQNHRLVQISTRGNVRGEVYMKKEEFSRLNKELAENSSRLLANPRNAAAGSLRALVPLQDRQSQLECLQQLEKLGFAVSPDYRRVSNIREAQKLIHQQEKKREDLNFENDGIVIKVNDCSYYELLGQTSKFPR